MLKTGLPDSCKVGCRAVDADLLGKPLHQKCEKTRLVVCLLNLLAGHHENAVAIQADGKSTPDFKTGGVGLGQSAT